jgi:DNA polymerase I-like protein with 3'-5' exonuclease and polymerase domains
MPILPRKEYAGVWGFDSEDTGLDLHHGASPFFVSFCNEQGQNVFFEFEVNSETRAVIAPKEDVLEIERIVDEADLLVAHNAKFDVKALRNIGVRVSQEWPWHKTRDTLMAAHLLGSNSPHDLTSQVLIHLNANILPYETDLKEAVTEAKKIAKRCYPTYRLGRKDLEEAPSGKPCDYWLPRQVAIAEGYPEDHPWFTVLKEYGNVDSAVTLSLYKRQMELIEKQDLMEIYEERLKLIPVIFAIEQKGITINRKRTEQLKQQYTKASATCREVCLAQAPGEIDELPKNGSSNALKHVLFDVFELKSPKKTPKGQDSIDKYVLDEWLLKLPEGEKAHTFIKSLQAYRKRQTALGYIASYEKFWIPDRTNRLIKGLYRIHPSLNPTGTDTLRFSSENPNSQQIAKLPIAELGEDKGGYSARYMFGPAPGREWWSLDYENIELRVPSFSAGEEDAIYVFTHPEEPPYYGSYHLLVAELLHPKEFAKYGKDFKDEFASTLYQWTKNGSFAVIYGAQEETTDRTYHVPGAYANIQRRFPKIAALSRKMIEMADRLGYVETMPDKSIGAKRGYPIYCSRSRWGKVSPTVPLNYHVQSTAMQCTCKAMVRCQEYLKTQQDCYMVLQVHDEIVFDLPARGKDNLPIVNELRRLMAMSGEDIGVPLSVSASYHPRSWGEKEKLAV